MINRRSSHNPMVTDAKTLATRIRLLHSIRSVLPGMVERRSGRYRRDCIARRPDWPDELGRLLRVQMGRHGMVKATALNVTGAA